jgi:hypothetical protein
MIIGLLGLIGSGKGTVAEHLVEKHNFVPDSFAATLKDACAVIFSWPRPLLEGNTPESREWRETVDLWWSKELNIPNFTPRLALQLMGTDTIRNHFHKDMWLLTMKHRIQSRPGQNIVISDARFPNEVQLIKEAGGILIQVTRSHLPDWYDIATEANRGDEAARLLMVTKYCNIHTSEWSWCGTKVDYGLANDADLRALYRNADSIVRNILR